MAGRGLNLSQVARTAQVPYTTLADYSKGATHSLNGATESKLATAFDVPTEEIFGGRKTPREVPVVGYVGAGAAAHFYDVGQGELDRVAAPENATDKTVAAEIRGTSIGEFYDGWLLFYDQVQEEVTPDFYKHVCVVGLPDGRILVKKIMPAPSGRFHLLSQNEPPILDQEVAWAAKVTGMRPR